MGPTATPGGPSSPSVVTAPHGLRIGGLDGLRALAVLAVIFFHSGMRWMVGGYYGVDAFFVLSGFLITRLLVGEWSHSGAVSLSRFWAGRARRLLPGLLVMLTAVCAFAAIWPSVLGAHDLPVDTLATLFYVSNWHLAAVHASYFSAFANPSPLLHTWTLGVEEQFYLLWPLVLIAFVVRRRSSSGDSSGGSSGSRFGSKRARLTLLLVASATGAVASALWMAVLTPLGSEPIRSYYGTDTRAQGLLIGASLALLLAILRPVTSATLRRGVGVIGIVGASGMIAIWCLLPETAALAFRGGFALVGLCSAAVVAAAVIAPESPVPVVLSSRPLRYLGRISYGMYLWYWPVLLVMTIGRTHLDGLVLVGARVAVIVLLAATSFRFVEQPVRQGALRRWRAIAVAPSAAALAAVVVLLASLASVPASGTGLASASSAAAVLSSSSLAAGRAASPAPSSSSASSSQSPALSAQSPSSSSQERPVRILVVGDSLAGTLGVGLSEVASHYGATVVDRGYPGCSASTDQQIRDMEYIAPPGAPCVAGDPAAILGVWQSLVTQFQPDVVVYLARAEILDQEHNSQWTNIEDPAFASWVRNRLEAAVSVFSSAGASVVLLTPPYFDTGGGVNADPPPEDDPARITADDAIIREVASAYQGTVTVIDTGSMLSPGGQYTTSIGGVDVRCGDGVHISVAGGQWLGARILPELVALGHAHEVAAPNIPPAPPEGPPSWFAKLPCGAPQGT